MDYNIFTVAFFGHRSIFNVIEIEKLLDIEIEKIIGEHEFTEFLVGRNGEFDSLASSAVRRAARRFGSERVSLVLVLPYVTAEFSGNEDSFREFYDEIELCEKAAKSHFKSAIQIRNRSMIDRADLVISYICEERGGAYSSVRYAKNAGIPVINLSDMQNMKL